MNLTLILVVKNCAGNSNGFSKTSLCSDWSNSINFDQSDARKVGWLLLENSDWPIREDARSVDQWNWSCQPDTQQFQPSQAELSSVNWAGTGKIEFLMNCPNPLENLF